MDEYETSLGRIFRKGSLASLREMGLQAVENKLIPGDIVP